MKRFVALLLSLITASSAFAQSSNILDAYNGDFESGLTQWRFFEVPTPIGSTASVVTTDVARGLKAVKIVFVTASGSLVDRALDNWDTNVPVTAGESYTASVQAKSTTGSAVQLRITLGFFDDTRLVLNEVSQNVSLTDVYQTCSVQQTAPAGAVSCWIALRLVDGSGPRAAGTLFLDDAQLIGAGGTPLPTFAPRVMTTTLPSEDVPIASLLVTDPAFAAKNDGSADATAAFQQAIDYAASRGGGVVYAPAGSYRFDGSLTLKEKVTLRGDWQSPEQGGTGKGTILKVYGGQGNAAGTPFLSINRGSGVRNLTIWYPQQTATAVPYPWTILCNPDNAAGRGDNTSVINVTMVNPYQAIKVGPASNELHYIRNVYGTPLQTGIWLSQTTDIGRIINVHFEPKYWSASSFSGSPSEASIKAWTQANAEGIVMGRSDWEYMCDISLIGYQTGIRIFRYDPAGPAANGVMYGMRIDEGEVGIKFEMANPYGFAITQSVINASVGENPVCILAGDSFATVAQFHSCTFGGSPRTAVLFEANSPARMTFQNCTFAAWGNQPGDAAVQVEKGSVAIIGSTFVEDKLHVSLGTGVTNAQIIDNAVPGTIQVRNLSSGEVAVSQEPLGLAKLTALPHPFAAERTPATNALFVVTDYGALGDNTTDGTLAFQAALDAAGNAGGGTVYVPAGWYKISTHLNVPTGVELRGIWDVPHHTISQGTVLLASEGIGNAGGTPFITLQPNSGVRGLTVWYPDQNYSIFPWTIQTRGAGCWIKDVTLANSYQGIDLASYASPNHVVSYVGGSPLKTGIYVSNNTGEGWVENVQFNSHYWKRSSGYPTNVAANLTNLTPYQQANLDALKFGSCANEHQFGNFVFAAKRGLYFTNDGGPCTSDVFLHGTDAGAYAISVESPAGSTLNFINSQLVLTAAASQGYIYTGPSFAGTALFANTLEWGNASGLSAAINGTGLVSLQLVNSSVDRISISGGNAEVSGVTMSSFITPQFTITAGTTACRLFGNYSPAEFQMSNGAGDAVEADYNFLRTKRLFEFFTSWEPADVANTWNNTLFDANHAGNGTGEGVLQCRSVNLGAANALIVGGTDQSPVSSSLYFKTHRVKIPVLGTSVLQYSVFPLNELGRGVHVDLLFSDGSRLSGMNPKASDSLLLRESRGSVLAWNSVTCPIGLIASGKTIQEILVGYDHAPDTGAWSARIDSLRIAVGPAVPAPWTSTNVGGATPGGIAVVETESYNVLGGGTGLQYGGDSFHFLSQPWTGDVALTANLQEFTSGPAAAFAGIMIRESTSPTARFALIGLYPAYGIQTLFRMTSVSSVQAVLYEPLGKSLPRWLRLLRVANRIFSQTSADGVTWSDTLHQLTLALDSTVLVGLAVGSGVMTESIGARFDGVSVSPPAPVSVERDPRGSLPGEYRLYPNYPNPFNPATTLNYDLPVNSVVEMSVFTIHGQHVATLVRGEQAAGRYHVQWSGATDAGVPVASGMYLCRLKTQEHQFVSKMLLLR